MQRPPRVVAFGGGTGLPVMLAGLRDTVGQLTAVVTVADDGGSSGRLRQELGIAPPGDLRNCLVALAGRRNLAQVFNYRFEGGGAELRDHTVGNIIIAALADIEGGFVEGVDRAARFLRARGRVLPAATESLTLVVRHADGTVTRGESTVGQTAGPIAGVSFDPPLARAPPAVIEAIAAADLVVLGPGSLFTSTIASLLAGGVREALARCPAPIAYVANLMTERGETERFTVSDHLRAITDHVGSVVTDVVVSSDPFGETVLARYAAEGAEPVAVDRAAVAALGVRLHEVPLLAADGPELRHDSALLSRLLRGLATERRPA